MTPSKWKHFTRKQHGNVAYRQLRAVDMSHDEIRHAVRSGRLTVVYRGVYRDRELDREGRWSAAVLALGEGAGLCRVPAGLHWGILERRNEIPHVSVPRNRTGPEGVKVHRVPGLQVVTHRGISITTLNQTIVDLAGVLDERGLRGTLRRGVQEQGLDLRVLQQHVAFPLRDPRKARVRAQLELWLPNEELTQSELEARFYALVAGLPLPELQRPFGPYRSDFVWERERLIVETDGRHHLTPIQRQADAERDRALMAAGYRVMRFLWADVVNRPRMVIREVAAALTTDGPAGAGPSMETVMRG